MRRALLLASSAALAGSLAHAATYIVRPDATGDFATIQAAIDAASPGDVVQLGSGVFHGPGNRDLSFGGKSITVRSASGNPRQCTIDCDSNNLSRHRAFHFTDGEGPGAVVDGIRIINGRPPSTDSFDWGGAIAAEYSSPTIRHCLIEDNVAYSGNGFAFFESQSVVEDVDLTDWIHCARSDLHFSRITMHGGAGFSLTHSNAVFENCTVASCTGNAWYLQFESSIEIIRSIAAFGNDPPVSCTNSSAVLTCTDLFGNTGGDWVGCISDQESMNGNLSADPLFCVGHSFDYEINEDSPCAAEHSPCGDLIGAWAPGCATVGTGACCITGTGECVITNANLCAQGGEYQGDGSTCDPSPCNTASVPPSVSNSPLLISAGNPAIQTLHYSIALRGPADARISLVDPRGAIVAELRRGWLPAGEHRFTYGTAALPSGVYWLVAATSSARQSVRVTLMK